MADKYITSVPVDALTEASGRFKEDAERHTMQQMRKRAEQKLDYLTNQLEHLNAMENTNRIFIKSILRRLDALERGETPEPMPTPDALRAEDI